MLAHRAGEGALGVPEQLAFQQLLGQRAAVDRHEGLVGASARLMDGVGQQFLARAGGPGDQHADIRGRHHARLLEDALHLRAAGDDLGTPGIVAGPVGARRLCHGFLDGGEQLVAVHRLGEKAEHPLARGAHRIRDGAVRGENDHRHARRTALQFVKQRHAVHFVHAQVGEHQVGAVLGQAVQCLASALGGGHAVASAFQAHAQQLEQAGVVIDQQNMRGGVLHVFLLGLIRAVMAIADDAS